MSNFNSKETYLADVAEWKANYARLTTAARQARKEYNDAQAAFSKVGSYQWGSGYNSEANKAYNEAYAVVEKARGNRAGIRAEANLALGNRAMMKEEAARQWAAQRAIA